MKEKYLWSFSNTKKDSPMRPPFAGGMQCINVEQRVYHTNLIILDVKRELFGGKRDFTHNF
jgi:hypothetical protein